MAGLLRHKENLYLEQQTVEILGLAPEARMQRILAMPADELIAFRKSLSGGEKAELAEG